MARIVITITDNPADADLSVNIATEFEPLIDISKPEELTEAQKAAVAMLGNFISTLKNVQVKKVSA